MIKGWLIYSELDSIENKAYIEWFITEAKKQLIDLQLVLREKLTIGVMNNKHYCLLEGQQVELPNFAVVRTVESILNRQLEHLGIQVFNSSHLSEVANHKAKTYFEVAKLGIPMMDTIFVKSHNLTDHTPMPYPFVIKEATGRGGRQVFFIRNQKEWESFYHDVKPSDYVIQSTEVKLGKDLRVFVVGKEIIAAVLRESNTDFRANYKLGGSATLYSLSREEKALIDKIIHHFNFGMVGIDFLIGHNGELIFNEIEDIVGSRTLSAVSDINLLEKYVGYIRTSKNQDS
ncbi:ATP-grasp domain-containing protein [Ornithinibacillus californiensis]|uniref:ATP-grasp domain-containing protein n=1 Tax=Ornithinibacillus californiensis TaxID=161536 RepID=UPI00064DB42C|nr:ATP-grasp domain-containing protein [Ornithinibacillus californiensis]